jgi:hypothetical protein
LILGGTQNDTGSEAAGSRTTLDALFRRAAIRGVDAIALSDPPNRDTITGRAPRHLTYAQADRAISAFAARLRQLGLQTDTVVALQLPNTIESVIALLGVIRAGMIAAQLPLLWRKHDIASALRPLNAKAIVTSSRIGSVSHAEIAMQAAADLFPVRYVGAFGSGLPDGVVAFDDIFAPAAPDFEPPPARAGNSADHVAVVTFDESAAGIRAVARSQKQLIAGGLGPYLENGAVTDGKMLSAIPLGSFAGLSLTLLPWLLGGGTLSLHHAFYAQAFAAQAREHDGGTVVLPGPALRPLTKANSQCRPASIVALWRAPERLAAETRWNGAARLIDVASFGETGLIAATRGEDRMPAPIAAGMIGAPRGSAGATMVVETMRSPAGTLVLRGPMVPAAAFSSGAEAGGEPHPTMEGLGFADTGYPCRFDRDSSIFVVTAPPGGITSVGGYRLHQVAVDAAVAGIDRAATIVALPDAVLGQRLAGSAEGRDAVIKAVQARGCNALIAAAFEPRTQNAA